MEMTIDTNVSDLLGTTRSPLKHCQNWMKFFASRRRARLLCQIGVTPCAHEIVEGLVQLVNMTIIVGHKIYLSVPTREPVEAPN